MIAIGTIEVVSVGKPQALAIGDRQVRTSIRKAAVSGAVVVTYDGLAGDEQADRRVHGGPGKAVCVYPAEHYPFWEGLFGVELQRPSFGENLTTRGLDERATSVGDVFQAGSVLLQVSQLRTPCFRLAAMHSRPRMIDEVLDTGRTGFYFSVLEPGEFAAGDKIYLVAQSTEGVPIQAITRQLVAGRGA